MRHIHTSILSGHLTTRGNTKYCARLHNTLSALKRYFPASLVTPLPNSEQINCPSSNHTYTKSTLRSRNHYGVSVYLRRLLTMHKRCYTGEFNWDQRMRTFSLPNCVYQLPDPYSQYM